ncbi:MAG: MFS transporter [Chloroflexota bacterium]
MTTPTAGLSDGRPTDTLPVSQLLRMTLYWFGLSSIFIAVDTILGGRLEYQALVPAGEEGRALVAMTVGGALVAVLVQPTVGSISDYTISRWGRRKPYILIGSLLDVVFLFGVASSNTVVSIAAFVILLQFSSNFAQGPFQGYVPDLVPAHQVGLASGLVGLMQVLGNITGAIVASVAVATNQFFLGTIAVGIIELLTMISVFLWVNEGRVAKDRAGRSWLSVAAEAWGLDILKERSFIWLVTSRLAFLMATNMLIKLAIFYLSRSHGLDQEEAGGTLTIILGFTALGTIVAVLPSARLSDRVGRKRVIYASCAIGALGLGIVAVAPSIPVALVGVVIYGLATGSFLAVDWALMTDIIPKASSGRFMGISNVATASAGVIALATGGTLMDIIGGPERLGSGPRAALALGVALFVVAAILLRPVDERRREEGLPDVGAVSSGVA